MIKLSWLTWTPGYFQISKRFQSTRNNTVSSGSDYILSEPKVRPQPFSLWTLLRNAPESWLRIDHVFQIFTEDSVWRRSPYRMELTFATNILLCKFGTESFWCFPQFDCVAPHKGLASSLHCDFYRQDVYRFLTPHLLISITPTFFIIRHFLLTSGLTVSVEKPKT